MKTSHVLKAPEHASYKAHRRQFWIQIMVPVLLATLLFIIAPVAMWLNRMGGAGDLARWSAISTMWLLVPVIIGLIVLIVIVIAGIYLIGQVNRRLPGYSRRAQRFAEGAAMGTGRAAEMVQRPILAVRALGNAVRTRFRRLRERE
jgi:hypothetical protein